MLYTINFSIEAATKDQLQQICDNLVSDLAQRQSKQPEPIQLNQYSIDQDEECVYIEAEVVNLIESCKSLFFKFCSSIGLFCAS